MSDTQPQPTIHNTSGEFPTVLTGLHIVDPSPFTEALQALGVPAAEVPNWSIYTAPPKTDPERDGPAIVLDPRAINSKMIVEAYGSDKERRNWRFVEAFKAIAPRAILQTMATRIATKQLPEKGFLHRHREGLLAASAMTTPLTTTLIRFTETQQSPFTDLSEGMALGILLNSWIYFHTSPKRQGKKLLARALREDSELETRLSEAVKPRYNGQ